MPRASELRTLYSNKAAVNAALQTLGGETIERDYSYYWSSNENSGRYALTLNLSNSIVHYNGKVYSTPYARCAVAY